jgi:hypothetical protein
MWTMESTWSNGVVFPSHFEDQDHYETRAIEITGEKVIAI